MSEAHGTRLCTRASPLLSSTVNQLDTDCAGTIIGCSTSMWLKLREKGKCNNAADKLCFIWCSPEQVEQIGRISRNKNKNGALQNT